MRAGREEAILAGPPEAIHEPGLAHGVRPLPAPENAWTAIARRDDDDAILVDPDEAAARNMTRGRLSWRPLS
jgi:hypothetical protein